MDDYDSGPLTEAQIMKRIIACEKTLAVPMMTAGGHKYTLKYAYVSQRGYYPNALDKENQDAFTVVTSVNGCKHAHFFGVFDGHGSTGDLCSRFTAEKVPENFCTVLPTEPEKLECLSDDKVKKALISAYRKTNAQLRGSAIDDSLSGTTAIGVFLKDQTLYVANTGDSRAILIGVDTEPGFENHVGSLGEETRFLAEALSIDQTPFRQDERDRVRRAGAVVMTMDQIEGLEPIHDNWGTQLGEEIDESGDPPRVWHQDLDRPGCAFTRSIGDSIGESIGVVPDPELLIRELTGSDAYVVLASDGVFEFITSQTVAEMVGLYKDPLIAARKVVHEAYKLWLRYEIRTDDITIIILKLEGLEEALLKEQGPPRKGSTPVVKSVRQRPANMITQEQRPVRKFFSRAKRQVIMEQSEAQADQEEYNPSDHRVPKTGEEVNRLRSMVSRIFLFQQMDSQQIETIIGVMFLEHCEAGQPIILEGEKGDKFFVVDSGEYEVTVGDEMVTKYTSPGDSFGELSLLYGKPRTANVTALTHGSLWVLERRAFKTVLIKRISGFNLLQILRNVPILKPLNKLQLQKLCSQFTEQVFKDGDLIIRQGEPGDKFYIIKAGKAVASTKKEGKKVEIRKMDRLDCFGERALLSNEPRSADITAKGDITVLWLKRDTFNSIIGDLQSLLQVQINRQESYLQRQDTDLLALSSEQTLAENLQFQKAQLRLPHGFVGEFLFKPNGHEFSAKVLSKEKSVKLMLNQQVLTEKDILTMLTNCTRQPSPFLPALKHSFQSTHCAYIIYKKLVVGDLNQLLSTPMTESQARYFGACILSAVSFVHEEGIIHRRITPDCIYITEQGYPQLSDMSCAKRMDGQLAYTLVGDAQYFAPEQIAGQGYDHLVDYWAMGILLYEMLHLSNPFGDENTEEKELYINISQYDGHLEGLLPELSAEAKDFILQLLSKDKAKRIGAEDFEAIQDHPWFSGLDWNTLDAQENIPQIQMEAPKTSRMRREEIENEFFSGESPPLAVDKMFEAF